MSDNLLAALTGTLEGIRNIAVPALQLKQKRASQLDLLTRKSMADVALLEREQELIGARETEKEFTQVPTGLAGELNVPAGRITKSALAAATKVRRTQISANVRRITQDSIDGIQKSKVAIDIKNTILKELKRLDARQRNFFDVDPTDFNAVRGRLESINVRIEQLNVALGAKKTVTPKAAPVVKRNLTIKDIIREEKEKALGQEKEEALR